jgi:D-alanine-D-alanine ligase-like ATP-grasp enzyme
MSTPALPIQHAFSVALLLRLAHEIGATVLLEPDTRNAGGLITFPNGKRVIFRGNEPGLNAAGPKYLARHKHAASLILQQSGFPVPRGALLRHDDPRPRTSLIAEGWEFAQQVGLPAIIKPNSMNQGKLVTKIYTEREYLAAANAIFAVKAHMLVQRFHTGNDYRVVVLDGQVMSAYQRIPPAISGDGQSTNATLIARYKQSLQQHQRTIKLDLNDSRIAQNLRRSGHTLESIPAPGEQIMLLDNANLSSGGTAIDVTDQISTQAKQICTQISTTIGLRLCGIDLLAQDLSQPINDYVILEVNPTPGMQHFAAMGPAQLAIVEQIYRRILAAMEAT